MSTKGHKPNRRLIHEYLTEDGLLRIEGWARDGLSNDEIARSKIGINPATFYDWKKKHPEIDSALKKGQAPVDTIVENALYRRATGYKTIERRKIKLPDGTARVEVIEKEVPPDTTAGIFWLANRKPNSWKRRQVDEIKPKNIQPEDRQAVEEFLAAGDMAKEINLEEFLNGNEDDS